MSKLDDTLPQRASALSLSEEAVSIDDGEETKDFEMDTGVDEVPFSRQKARSNAAGTPPDFAGDYKIEERIGEGGFADVYRAKHRVMRRLAAVKILHFRFAQDAEIAERFEREARAVCTITSDDVVDIYDFGMLDDGRPYYAMELIQGETLRAHMDARGILEPAQVVALLTPVARALAAAHEKGVVHRDVKPGNVMLQQGEGDVLRPRLVDFGIAHLAVEVEDHRLTLTGHTVGTPKYMPPEQALGRKVDARADVYALGIVAFEALSGNAPFSFDSFHEMQAAHIHHRFPAVHEANTRLPRDASRVLSWMCAKDPADRPGSVVVALAELALALDGKRLQNAPSEAFFSDERSNGVSKTGVLLVGAVFMALLAYSFFVSRQELRQDVSSSTEPSIAAKKALFTAPIKPLTPVRTKQTALVRFQLTPSQTQVFLEGKRIVLDDKNEAALPKTAQKKAFLFRAPGFEAQTLQSQVTQNTTLTIALKKDPTPKKRPLTTIKTDPNKMSSPQLEGRTAAPLEVPRGPNDLEPW